MAVKPLEQESDILAKIAQGDQYAFTTLFNHYQRDVFVFSKKLTHSEELAVEIVQDIFLKIWMVREKLAELDNFGAYLNRIVRNHSFNVIRQLAQQTKSEQGLKLTISEVDDSTLQQLDYNDAVRLLNEALEELPPQQKLVYQLCHQEGLKYEQAAEQMEVSVETVRAHMKQALKKIRTHFKNNAMLYPMLILAMYK